MLLYPRPDSAIAAMAAQQQHLAGATSSSLPSADGQFECDTEISSHLLKHQSSIGNHASNLSSKGCSSSPQAKRLHLAAPCSDGHTLSAPEVNVKGTTQSLSYSKLEVKEEDGQVVLHSTIPDGFAIVDNEVFEGKKIIATKNFKEGDLLYIASAALLDLSTVGQQHTVNIYSEDQNGNRILLETVSNTDTHSVDDYAVGSKSGVANNRQVYGWDAFMNHSCHANAYFPLLSRTESEIRYQALALRDIDAGMEVTCDYALFDYTCGGHEILNCACGSEKCRGKMLGFHALSIHEKVEILHLCEDEIKEKFITSENVKVFQSCLPEGISIASTDGEEKHHVATRNFEPGDIIFKNRVEIISRDELASNKTFVLEVDGKFHLLDKDHHFIYRAEYSEMLGFDSFMDHSCSPNTHQVYTNKEEYVVYASKTILRGDKITCDYMVALDNTAVGSKNVSTTTFKCNCGESNCYGVLVC